MPGPKFLLTRAFLCAVLCAGFALTASAAGEATAIGKFICMGTGANDPEPIAGQEERALQVWAATCRAEGGPTDGGVLTEHSIWDMSKGGAATMVSGDGVLRKRGGMAVYRLTAGTRTINMTDGKVSGWTVSGKGVWSMATGAAAPLANKSFSLTARPTGHRQYVIESVLD